MRWPNTKPRPGSSGPCRPDCSRSIGSAATSSGAGARPATPTRRGWRASSVGLRAGPTRRRRHPLQDWRGPIWPRCWRSCWTCCPARPTTTRHCISTAAPCSRKTAWSSGCWPSRAPACCATPAPHRRCGGRRSVPSRWAVHPWLRTAARRAWCLRASVGPMPWRCRSSRSMPGRSTGASLSNSPKTAVTTAANSGARPAGHGATLRARAPALAPALATRAGRRRRWSNWAPVRCSGAAATASCAVSA